MTTEIENTDEEQAQDEVPHPFGADRIADDIQWYGHLCREGEWFVEPATGQCYIVEATAVPDGPMVRLAGAHHVRLGDDATFVPIAEPHQVSTVSELAGAVELGDLFHIPAGCIIDSGQTHIVRKGGILFHFDINSFEATDRVAFGGHSRDVSALLSTDELPEPALFIPPTVENTSEDLSLSTVSEPAVKTIETVQRERFNSEDQSVLTRFIPVEEFAANTLDSATMRQWVESHLPPGAEVLNACAGQNRLNHDGTIVRNDIRERIEADTHLDVAELASEFPKSSFDVIFFDPPWSLYQSNLRYESAHVHKKTDVSTIDIDLSELPDEVLDCEDEHLLDAGVDDEKEQLGHARLAKEGFDYLLRSGGKVIELSFQGSCMPARMHYERVERSVMDPIGEGKSIIASVDRSVQNDLGAFI